MAHKHSSHNHHKIHEVKGGLGHDHLKGGAGDDSLSGGAGDDSLSGSAGDDVLNGGDGTDTVVMSGSDAAVVDLNLTRAQRNGHHGADKFISIENLIGTKFGDHFFGDEGSNTLDGGAGNDRLDGRAGDDDLIGGRGNDRLNGGLGNDKLDGGVGNDRVEGGDGDDAVSLDLGNDVLRGGAGSDTLVVGDKAGTIDLAISRSQKTGYGHDKISGFENVTGGLGDDHFAGNAAANKLDGGAGNDALNGRDGDDVLVGGTGADQLTGGLGNDTFQFGDGHSGTTSATMDVIADFEIGKDKIDLSLMDADTGTDGVQHFLPADFSPGNGAPSPFTKAGQLYFDQDSGILYGNVNADAAADFAIQLKGVDIAKLATGDFVL